MSDVFETCDNCGSEISEEEYNRTGVSEFCEECSDDPRGQTFGYLADDAE